VRSVERRGVRWNVDESFPVADWFWGEWCADTWEGGTLDIVDRFARPGTTFVDVGAWIGIVSMWAARNGARVIAIEPDPVARASLNANVRFNDCDIEVVAGAVDDVTGTTHLRPHERFGFGDSMTQLSSEGLETPCWRLEDIFESYGIENCSLVKMDVEGHEAVLLPTVASFLADRKIPLFVSMHEPHWAKPPDSSWLSHWSDVIGEPHGFASVLCIP
jgi:FkbM family methyltransferase